MGGSDAPAVLFFERDQAGLPRQHLDGNAQNARQQLFQVKLLGEGARNFEQIVALADAEVR